MENKCKWSNLNISPENRSNTTHILVLHRVLEYGGIINGVLHEVVYQFIEHRGSDVVEGIARSRSLCCHYQVMQDTAI